MSTLFLELLIINGSKIVSALLDEYTLAFREFKCLYCKFLIVYIVNLVKFVRLFKSIINNYRSTKAFCDIGFSDSSHKCHHRLWLQLHMSPKGK